MMAPGSEIATDDVEARARLSLGTSGQAIYEMVARAVAECGMGGDLVLDVGCGTGNLRPFVGGRFARYSGADVVRYPGFPEDAEFHLVNLDSGRVSLPDGCADTVVAVETIEHLENPRAFMRELVRLAKPGGWVMVTTPNQVSLLSKLTFFQRNQFNAFQDGPGLYPAHITALLEIDLLRMARECGLGGERTFFTNQGRIPFTPWSWPARLGFRGRAFSDNLMLAGQRRDSRMLPSAGIWA